MAAVAAGGVAVTIILLWAGPYGHDAQLECVTSSADAPPQLTDDVRYPALFKPTDISLEQHARDNPDFDCGGIVEGVIGAGPLMEVDEDVWKGRQSDMTLFLQDEVLEAEFVHFGGVFTGRHSLPTAYVYKVPDTGYYASLMAKDGVLEAGYVDSPSGRYYFLDRVGDHMVALSMDKDRTGAPDLFERIHPPVTTRHHYEATGEDMSQYIGWGTERSFAIKLNREALDSDVVVVNLFERRVVVERDPNSDAFWSSKDVPGVRGSLSDEYEYLPYDKNQVGEMHLYHSEDEAIKDGIVGVLDLPGDTPRIKVYCGNYDVCFAVRSGGSMTIDFREPLQVP